MLMCRHRPKVSQPNYHGSIFIRVNIPCFPICSRFRKASTLQRTEQNFVLASSRLTQYDRLAALGHKWLEWKSTLDNSAGRLSADACAWALIFTPEHKQHAVLSVFPQNSQQTYPNGHQHAKERKKKQILTDLQLTEKEETGVQGGVPLSAAETNLPKA